MVRSLGFIGLDPLGETICRHLLRKSGRSVVVYDHDPQSSARIKREGAITSECASDVVKGGSEVLFLRLPTASDTLSVFESDLLPHVTSGQTIVDLNVCEVEMTREFGRLLSEKGATWIDAPISGAIPQAAENGTLKVLVGGSSEEIAQIDPLLRHFVTDVISCGPTGAGQVVRILNNMVLFQNVNAISEAVSIALANGVEANLLLQILSQGSADSFALKYHGMNSILTGDFQSGSYSTEEAFRDISYAIEAGADSKLAPNGAKMVQRRFEDAISEGLADFHYSVIAKLIDRPDRNQ